MNRAAKHFYEFGSFRLDTAEHLLLQDGRPVPLKPKVFDLLLELVTNSSHVLTKDELMKQIWPDSFVEEHNLAVSISTLRKALGEDHSEQPFIETVPRRGYRFVAGVREVWDESADMRSGSNVRAHVKKEASVRAKSIAALPFKHIGAKAAEEEYLGLGLADALITRLSNLRQIVVRPTSAVRRYDGEQDPVAAGRELRVSAVLDGSVQRFGKRIRVTVQLVSVHDGASLWAGKFDETFTNIFAVEDSISEHVATALMLKLTDKERKQLRKRYTENTEAYQAYLKGRYFLGKRTVESFGKSFGYFEQAISIDPEYALAYAGLADYYLLLMNFNVLPPQKAGPQAKEAALKALRFDDTLAEAHASLAYLKGIHEWDWAGAEREFERAIELNANDAIAHQFYSIYLRVLKRFDEAMAEAKKAQELDPLSLSINTSVGSLFYFARQYDQAIEQLSKTLELDPNFVMAHFYLGWAFEQKGMYEEAIAAFQKVVHISGNVPEFGAGLGHAYAVSGNTVKAREVLNELKALAKQRYVSPYDLALIHTGLGEEDEALDWLEKAYEERSVELALLKVDQRLDTLRKDSRFTDVLRLIGFPL